MQNLYSQLTGNNTLDITKQDVLEGVISEWKDTFCTDAVYTPASKNPATFTGNAGCSALALSCCLARLFSTSSCTYS